MSINTQALIHRSAQLAHKARNAGRSTFAKWILKYGKLTVNEYLEEITTIINQHPKPKLSEEFKRAIEKHMKECGYKSDDVELVIKHLQTQGWVQEAHHTSLIPQPRFLTLDVLASQLVKKEDPYIVAQYSGIPLSNKTGKPSTLVTKTGELIKLAPANLQDIPAQSTKMIDIKTQEIPTEYKNHFILPQPSVQSDWYVNHAVRVSADVTSSLLGKKTIVIDGGEITRNYCIKVLQTQNDNHPIVQLLTQPGMRASLAAIEPSSVFIECYQSKRRKKMGVVLASKEGWLSRNNEGLITIKEQIIEKLQSREWHPGMFLFFFVWSFLEGIAPAGSFMQPEYLPEYAHTVHALPWSNNPQFKTLEHRLCITGEFSIFQNTTPIELLLANKQASEWQDDFETTYMIDLWEPIEGVL